MTPAAPSGPYDVVIIGAGPAGLVAAYELLRADASLRVLILEASAQIGGLSQTAVHHGNRIDIGGHRFFSKSDWVVRWWLDMLPLAHGQLRDDRGRALLGGGPVAEAPQGDIRAMLIRSRLSRIIHGGQFFDYPLTPDLGMVRKLGVLRTFRYGISYVLAKLFPRKPETTLEDFFINRFGRQLYRLFFKEYTEKVWGRACSDISSDWGAQRIKSLSVTKMITHALAKLVEGAAVKAPTSLIECFLYPALGPGQMWEATAERIRALGGEIRMEAAVSGLCHEGGRVTGVRLAGEGAVIAARHVVSTMPIRDLVAGMQPPAPQSVAAAAAGLEYRDFITVGLLLDRTTRNLPDNWIYIQEPGVRVGRLQVFNNWSPHLVADSAKVWVGLEYFCQEGDDLWTTGDGGLISLAGRELETIGLACAADVRDGVVIRMPKAYPGYYGGYDRFPEIRDWLDGLDNLFLIGRNGMHRYNNQDHSMLSAKRAAELILAGSSDKSSIWEINVDDSYHENKAEPS